MSDPTPSALVIGRELFVGLLALQRELVAPQALIAALRLWEPARTKALGQILVEQGALPPEAQAELETLARQHLESPGGASESGQGDGRPPQPGANPDKSLTESCFPPVGQADDLPLPGLPEAARLPGGAGLRFHVLRPHARGGFGEVFVAFDEELHREVALKEVSRGHAVHPDICARFLREGEITGGLEHPGVVPIYSLGRHADGRPFYAMRFIRGRSLREAIDHFHKDESLRRDPGARALALRKLLGHFVGVCNTVAYAHSRSVLHRDLKPANIMLGPYGETLVVDWGLAKVLVPGEEAADARADGSGERPPAVTALHTFATVSGTAMGTPAFMSPEQATGQVDEVGPASDIYSLGATFYVLLTGRAPFEGTEMLAVLEKVVRGDCRTPCQVNKDVPPPLDAVCRKAMALRPQDRYDSALALAADLEHWLADEPVSVYREPWTTRCGRWMRRHKPAVAAAAAAILAAVLLGGLGAWLWERHQADRRAEQARQEALHRRGVEEGLEEVARLQRQARWAEARTALAQTESRLREAGPEDLRGRLEQAQRDLDLVTQVDAIALAKATLAKGKFDLARADRDYAAAFAKAELGSPGDDAATVAERVRTSGIREPLLAALDDWAVTTRVPQRLAWLMAVARRADPDDWRDRFRDPKAHRDRSTLQRLADELLSDEAKKLKAQSPRVLAGLGNALMGAQGDAVPLLTEAREHYPSDFWLNFYLGNALVKAQKWGDAAGYYRAALAVRPNTPAVYNNLGSALLKGRLGGAIRAYQKAIHFDPNSAPTYNNYGLALAAEGRLDKATAAFRKAIELDGDYAQAHYNLGVALKDQVRVEELVPHFRKAAALDPSDAKAHAALGVTLMASRRPDEAVGELQQAGKLDPNDAQIQGNLGLALLDCGRFSEAQAAIRECLRLLPEGSSLRPYAMQQLQKCERFQTLDKKLSTILLGKGKPADTTERLDLARICLLPYKRYYATAARLYAEAIDAKPELVKDPRNHLRYDAACASALAGCGQGKDADRLGEKERARLRRQALDWLKADLVQWAKLAESDAPKARAEVRQTLQHWQTDPDLAGLREAAALRSLNDPERAACQNLWQEVEVLMKKCGG
jgi:serine/threonine-protein kinase